MGVPFKRPGESPHVREGWLGVQCPYCGLGTQNYGMGLKVWGSWLRSNCWKCGPHNAVRALADAAGATPGGGSGGILPAETAPPQSPKTAPSSPERRIRALLHSLTGIIDPAQRQGPLRACRVRPPPGIGPLRAVHRNFVFDQWGLDPDYLSAVWSVQGIGPDGGRWAWSLYIPVHDDDGTLVSWVCRFVESSCTPVKKGQVRYAAADPDREAVSHKTILYGSHLADHAVCVAEGCPDAWAVGVGGVALFGTGFTPGQVARIARFPVRVVVTDSDSPEAVRRGERLAEELMVHPGDTYRVVLESGKDPSRCNRRELDKLRSLLK